MGYVNGAIQDHFIIITLKALTYFNNLTLLKLVRDIFLWLSFGIFKLLILFLLQLYYIFI